MTYPKNQYCLITLLLISIMMLLVACEADNTPEPRQDGPILSGVGDLPKSLATVWLSPTPNGALASTTPLPLSPTPSETPEPPEASRTPTSAVGVFVGPNENGTPQVVTIAPIGIPSGGVVVGGTGGVVVGSIPGGGVPGSCATPVEGTFQRAYTENPSLAAQLGCPKNAGYPLTMVVQTFERGQMYWRDTKEIYALPSTGQYTRIIDTFVDGMPETDAAYDNPPAGLKQPIRGFGLAWRNNENVRNALGWAITGELAFPSYWQEFDGGFMFASDNNQVYAFLPVTGDTGQFSGPFAR